MEMSDPTCSLKIKFVIWDEKTIKKGTFRDNKRDDHCVNLKHVYSMKIQKIRVTLALCVGVFF